MTAIELLDTLRVLGVAVWMENGKLRLYAPQQHLLTPELQKELYCLRKDLSELIQREYVCWRCESSNVRFDVDRLRYVCMDCRRVLSDPLDAFPPLPELLLSAGAAYGYPELRLLPHVTLPAGREAWTRFCTAPFTSEQERLLLTAYRRLLYPAEQVDIDDKRENTTPNTPREEVDDTMKLRWTATEPVPTGEYPCEVVEVTEQQGKFGTQLVWKLRLIDPEHEGRELIAWTNTSTSTTSKLAKWASALGFTPEPGEELDTEDLVGRKAVAQVLIKRSDDGKAFNRVEDLLPLRTKKVHAKAAVSDPFEDEYE